MAVGLAMMALAGCIQGSDSGTGDDAGDDGQDNGDSTSGETELTEEQIEQLVVEVEVTEDVQPTRAPLPPRTPDDPPRELGRMEDPDGRGTDFVEDEVIITAEEDEAEAAAAAVGGEVVQRLSDIALEGPPYWLIHIPRPPFLDDRNDDPDEAMADFVGRIKEVSPASRGEVAFDDDRGVATIDVVARLFLDGYLVMPNILVEGAIPTTSWEGTPLELGSVSYGTDAYGWPYLADGAGTQEIGVTDAWDDLWGAGEASERRVRVAVIDGGFAPNADFPDDTVFLDATGAGAIDRVNPARCTGGSQCNWHGTGALLAIAGKSDNGLGGVGAGAPVAQPIAIQTNIAAADVIPAVLAATANGARVISMSFGGYVEAVGAPFVEAFWLAIFTAPYLADVSLVAAAGNVDQDVDSVDCFIVCWEGGLDFPCEIAGVICVGALEPYQRTKVGYSNHGTHDVDIWAPTDIQVLAPRRDAVTTDDPVLQRMGGTSAATPFVSGVIALMYAADPDLGAGDIARILRDTSTTGASPETTRVIDAGAAVAAALATAEPSVHIGSPGDGDTFAAGREIVRLEGRWWPRDGTDLQWHSSLDGLLGTGASVATSDLSPGTHTIDARAMEGSTLRASAQITLDIQQDPPQVQLLAPAPGEYQATVEIEFRADTLDWSQPDREVPDADVSWSSSLDGALGTGKTLSRTLGEGMHEICVTAENGAGSDEECVSVDVGPPPSTDPPTATITTPDPLQTHHWNSDSEFLTDHAHGDDAHCADVTLQGAADDPETGALTGSALQWSGSFGGGSYENLGTGTGTTGHLCAPTCNGGDYTIRLVATDPDGDTSPAQYVTVTIGTLC